MAWCTRVVFIGDRPLVDAVADAVPVEALVDRAQAAELVEDLLGGLEFEAGGAQALGDFGDDPPVGFGLADGLGTAARRRWTRRSVLACTPSVSPQPEAGKDDVGQLRGLGEEEVDDDEVVERLCRAFSAVVHVGVGDDGVFAVDEHGVDAIVLQAAEVERGDLGHAGIAKVEVGMSVGRPEFLARFRGNRRRVGSRGSCWGPRRSRRRPGCCSARASG